jgi:hypothetical protein
MRAMDWLAARPDVDAKAISVYGVGPLGPVALHLGAVDDRVAAIYADNSLTAYRMAVDQPIQRELPEVLPPACCASTSWPTWPWRHSRVRSPSSIRPTPSASRSSEAEFDKEMAFVRAADRKLGQPDRVRWTWRGGRDPLPLP